VKRKFRLTRSTDFKRVRRTGKSYAHPLIVLVIAQNELETSRFAVSAGRSIGNAVTRNRAKRLLREALRPLLPLVAPGRDILLLSRSPLPQARLPEIQEALIQLLRKAQLLNELNDH